MNAPDGTRLRSAIRAELLALRVGASVASDPNRALLASLIAGQAAGYGCLPSHLGLGSQRFASVLAQYFPGFSLFSPGRKTQRIPEWADLGKLLLDHRAGDHHSEHWMARIVATACAGGNHLWEDLGLANRDELSRLMRVNFPALAAANSGDMKWKKFIYRQYCAREGIYVCPAPSCGVCKDFASCFGSES